MLLSELLHAVGGVILMLLMLLTVGDVLGRYAFNQPVKGTVELTQLALVVIVFFGLGHTERRGGHLAIDTVFERLPAAAQRVLAPAVGVLNLTVVAVMTWQLYALAGRMLAGRYTSGVLKLPVYRCLKHRHLFQTADPCGPAAPV